MHTAIRTALLATALAAASSANDPAAASTFRDASAGVDCHAANGALAAKFTYNLNFLTNGGTTEAYVVCSLPMDDENQSPAALGGLIVDVFLPNAGSTVTCTAQTGIYGGGMNQVHSSAARAYAATGSNEYHQLVWGAESLHRDGVASVMTLNCKLPVGARMGLIQRWEDPVTPT